MNDSRGSSAYGRTREGLTRQRVEVVCFVLVVIAAALVRAPNVVEIPRFTDEGNHMIWAAQLARGEGGALRLNSHDLYRGPLFEYLVAILFRILGANPGLPRYVVLIFGALTVGFTYLVGRIVQGQLAGLFAAGMLMTAPFHILVNSHIAWSNSITPFFTTLGLAWFYLGARDLRGVWLAGGSFFLAVALQTHPLTILFAPPLLIWFLWRGNARDWLRSRWLLLTPLAAVLGYWNMLLYNFQHNLASFNQADQRGYALHLATDAPTFFEQGRGCLTQLLAMVSGEIGRDAEPLHYLFQLPQALVVWLVILSLLYSAWRGRDRGFLFTLVVGYILGLAYVNQDYSFTQTRYLAPIIPLAFVALGALMQNAAQWLWHRARANEEPARRLTPRAAYAALMLILVVGVWVIAQPLARLNDYYQSETARGYTNTVYLKMARLAAARPNRAAPVWVQPDSGIVWELGGGAGSAVYYPLVMWNQPARFMSVERLPRVLQNLPTPDAYLVLTPRAFTELKNQLPRYRFEMLALTTPQQEQAPNRIGLYHLVSRE